ncbi:MAG: TetR/AcrR family transcriptional regulator [Nannocystaceae bacterium]|nr:TetR/AcrR family transcriptional regulator [Nannocystaceae bacterium]
MADARRSDPEASRSAILAAARGCFSDKGLAGTSMSDIAARAKVTQSLIHHHFGAKDALWRQVLVDAFEEHAAQQTAQLSADDGTADNRARLRATLRSDFHFLSAQPDMLRLMAWAELQGAATVTDVMTSFRKQILQRVRDAQLEGSIRSDIPAAHILTVFMSLARTWFEERNLVVDESDARKTKNAGDDYLEASWALFSRGVLADRAKPQRSHD